MAPDGEKDADEEETLHVLDSVVTLKIEIIDRNPVNGHEEMFASKTFQNIDPRLTAAEVCTIVHEKIKDSYPIAGKDGSVVQKYRNATTRLGWGLFLPLNAADDVDGGDASSKDALKKLGGIDFSLYKMEYLEPNRTLKQYDIANHMRLQYKLRHHPVAVIIAGHERKILIDGSWTVYRIVEEIGRTLRIPDPEEYSIKTEDDPNNPEGGWLRGHQTLHEQNVPIIHQMSEDGTWHPPKPLIFKKKLYAADSKSAKLDNEQVIRLTYFQCHMSVIGGQLELNDSERQMLAGLQMQIEFGNHDPAVHKKGFLIERGLHNYYFDPEKKKKVSKVEADVFQKHAMFSGIERDDGMAKYIATCRTNENYGWSFWEMNEFIKGSRPRQYLKRPRVFALSGDGLMRLSVENKKPIVSSEWNDVGRYGENELGFFIEFTNEEHPFIMCPENRSESVKIIIQYVDDYLWYFKKRMDREKHPELQEHSGLWDDLFPVATSNITIKKRKRKKGSIKEVNSPFSGGNLPNPLTISDAPAEPWNDAGPAIKAAAENFASAQSSSTIVLPKKKGVRRGRKFKAASGLPNPTEDDARLEKFATVRYNIRTIVASISIATTDVVGAGCQADVKLMQAGVLHHAVKAIEAYMGELGAHTKEGAAVTTSAKEAAAFHAAYAMLGNSVSTLLMASSAVALSAANGEVEEGAVDDLLAAAKALGDALNGMLGVVGVAPLDEDIRKSLIDDVNEIHSMALKLGPLAIKANLGYMILSEADVTRERAKALPNYTEQMITTIDVSSPNVNLHLVQENLSNKLIQLLRMNDSIVGVLTDANDDLLTAASALNDAIRELIDKVDKAGHPPDYVAEWEARASEIDVAVAKILEVVGVDGDVKSAIQTCDGPVSRLNELAVQEAKLCGECGSHDVLVKTATALSTSVATFHQSAIAAAENPGDGVLMAACHSCADDVIEGTRFLLLERQQLRLTREIAEAVAVAVQDLDSLMELFLNDDNKEKRAVKDAIKAASRARSACRIFTVDPSTFSRQTELVLASRRLLQKGNTVVHQARPDYPHASHACDESLDALQAKISEAAEACWMMDVRFALSAIAEGSDLLHENQKRLSVGSSVMINESEESDQLSSRSQFQWLQSLVVGLASVPDLMDNVCLACKRSDSPTLGNRTKDLGTEMAAIILAVNGLASTTDGKEQQLSVLSSAEALCKEVQSLIQAAESFIARPEDHAMEASLEGHVQHCSDALATVALSLPGIGNIDRGIQRLRNTIGEIDATSSSGMMEAGLTLLDVAKQLAATISKFSVATDEQPEVETPGHHVFRESTTRLFMNEIKAAGRSLHAAINALESAAKSSPSSLAAAVETAVAIAMLLVDATRNAASGEDLCDDKQSILVDLKSLVEAVIAALGHARGVGSDANDWDALQRLRDNEVSQTRQALNLTLNRATAKAGTDGLDHALEMIAECESRLDPMLLPKADSISLSVKSLADDAIVASRALGDASEAMSEIAETNPDRIGRAAIHAASCTLKLVGCVVGTASYISEDGTPEETGVAPHTLRSLLRCQTSSVVAAVAAIGQTFEALATLDSVEGGKTCGNFRLAGAQIAIAARDCDEACQDLAVRLGGDGDDLVRYGASVRADGIALATAVANAADAEKPSVELKKQILIEAKRVLLAVDVLNAWTNERTGGDEDRIELSGSLKEPLLKRCKDVWEAEGCLMRASKQLVEDIYDLSAHKQLQEAVHLFRKKQEQLVAIARLVAPGQRECGRAIATATKAIADISKAAMEYAMDQFTYNCADDLDSLVSQLKTLVDEFDGKIVELGNAGYNNGHELGVAALAIDAIIPEIARLAKSTVQKVANDNPSLADRVLRESKASLEGLGRFIEVCQEQGGDSALGDAPLIEVEHTQSILRRLVKALDAKEATALDCSAACSVVSSAVAAARSGGSFQTDRNYSSFKDELTDIAKLLFVATTAVSNAITGDHSCIGPAAVEVSQHAQGCLLSLGACASLTPDVDARSSMLAAANDLAGALQNLIGAALEAANEQSTDISQVATAGREAEQALTSALQAAQDGAAGQRAMRKSTDRLNKAVGELMLAAAQAGERKQRSSRPFSEIAPAVIEEAHAVLKELEKLGEARGEDACGQACQAATKPTLLLLDNVGVGLSLLDDLGEQGSLLESAKALAEAMQMLVDNVVETSCTYQAPDPVLMKAAESAAHDVECVARQLTEGESKMALELRTVMEKLFEVDSHIGQRANALGSIETAVQSCKDVMAGVQGVYFAVTKSKAGLVDAIESLPDLLSKMVAALNAAAATVDDSLSVSAFDDAHSVIASTVALLDAIASKERKISDRTKGVAQAVMHMISNIRSFSSGSEDINPTEHLNSEVKLAVEHIDETRKEVAVLKEVPVIVKGLSETQEAEKIRGVAGMLECVVEVISSSEDLITVAATAHLEIAENTLEAHEKLVAGSRNTSAAMQELLHAVQGYLKGNADIAFVERSAKVVSTAIFEVVSAAMSKDPVVQKSDSQKAIKRSAKDVGKACHDLIELCKKLAVTADDFNVEDGAADAKDELAKRVEILKLEKKIQKTKQGL